MAAAVHIGRSAQAGGGNNSSGGGVPTMTAAQAYAARWDLSPNPTPRPIPIIPRQATAEQPYPNLSVRPLTSQCSLPNSVTVCPANDGTNNGTAASVASLGSATDQLATRAPSGQRASVSFERPKEGGGGGGGDAHVGTGFPCGQPNNYLVSRA
jgi:hypothetical protein